MTTARAIPADARSKVFAQSIAVRLAVILTIAVGASHISRVGSEESHNLLVGPAVERPTPSLRSGPAVWHQEYWDVKPEKFDQFVAAYKRDFYSLVRKVPGYRGYLMITTLPRAGESAVPVRRIYEPTYPHPHIFLEGKIKTERVINPGAFMHQVHNVLIVHSFQTWQDAATFKETIAKRYADEHAGADLWDHLAQSMFPFANNYWEADFRLALRGTPPQLEAPAIGSDADGLDLEPHPVSSRSLNVDVWDVSPAELSTFLRMYEKNTSGLMMRVPGWRGATIVTSIPPDAAEAKRTKYTGSPLGGADEFYVPQRGVMMQGTIPTDISINWSLLFKKTFTVVTFYNFTQDPYAATGIPVAPGHVLGNGYTVGPGGVARDILDDLDPSRSERIENETFRHIRNHWDMASYRPVESSLTFDLPESKP